MAHAAPPQLQLRPEALSLQLHSAGPASECSKSGGEALEGGGPQPTWETGDPQQQLLRLQQQQQQQQQLLMLRQQQLLPLHPQQQQQQLLNSINSSSFSSSCTGDGCPCCWQTLQRP
ncbi:hypothetical protein ETH_00029905 [Eimeria tenella]|uniref:Uncharacterized protein n=1 Tax=Eimeria tenella TaxID=5802 RepID=U6KPP3_EIMTE|nr:hypothetical protein ETH_00029905 [Eimeria tenella]CDJ38272.1 hypothetical protein ETH_00029905 [Eimeria tenella]|eukprot:XP_013229110.1 hypothetical protein ETH_00029905 [Eimeria tenella]